jgi:polyisoprenoid-binding protein YceI
LSAWGTACVGIAFAAAAGAAGPSEWKVDKASSSVQFSAVQEGSKFTGSFRDFTAAISFDPANPAQGSVVGTVKTASVDTHDGDRDSQLPDPDWFSSQQYPEARFESKSIAKADDGGYVAKGELTLKGKTHPIDLHFTFEPQGGTAAFAGTMTINRFDYSVGEGFSDPSFVGQDVDVTISLKLTK